MRFKSARRATDMPTVNLIPMMDVVMTILTFFVLVSMTLTHQKAVNIELPTVNASNGMETALTAVNPLLVELNYDGNVSIGNQQVLPAELEQQIKLYLANNPKGEVVLRVDKTVPYDQVAQLLVKMQAIGGKQVSLAING